MVLFLCAVICGNFLALLTWLLCFSLHKSTLLRHVGHMRVHCTYQNGKLLILACNQLANRQKQ